MRIRTAHFAPHLLDVKTARKVVVDYLRQLRGDKPSQRALSRQLGYSSNIVYQWESGRRVPSVEHAMQVAHKLAPDEKQRDFARRMASRDAVTQIVTQLLQGRCLEVAIERLGVSRHIGNRWSAGDSAPDFAQFLVLQDNLAGVAFDFLSRVIDPATLPSAAEEWTRRQDLRAILRAVPQASRILSVLELEDYRELEAHDDAWVAERLGVGACEVNVVLEQLKLAGFVQHEDGRYRSALEQFELIGALPSQSPEELVICAAVSEDQRSALEQASNEYLTRVTEILNRESGPKRSIAEIRLALEDLDSGTG